MKTQFITNEKGKKIAVILPIKEYEKILDELEELDDIKLYDEVKSREEESIPFDEYLKRRKQKKNAWLFDHYYQNGAKATW